MNRKPDVIQSLVFLFVVGLIVSGLSQLGTRQSGPAEDYSPVMQVDQKKPIWSEDSVWAFNASPTQRL